MAGRANESGWSTVSDVLLSHAAEKPQVPGFVFLADGEAGESILTYGELDRRARRVAGLIRSHGRHQRALLMQAAGPEFLVSLAACFYAGVTAVPAYPAHSKRSLERLRSQALDAGATLGLTDRTQIEGMGARGWTGTGMTWVATEEAPELCAQPEPVAPHAIALLQYTSGSTGQPRGVILTHAAILRQQRLLFERMEHPEGGVVTWLPPFHDMGLIGGLLYPLYSGVPCVWMPPMAFLTSPVRWLRAITKYRSTISGGPNFAYDLCVRAIPPEQREGLELSSWKVAFNGSEPVRAETIERFTAAFSPWGFRKEAFFPCYGLAEATLMVTGGTRNMGPAVVLVDGRSLQNGQVEIGDGKSVVGCGTPSGDQLVTIVDPESRHALPLGRTGEIWVAGAGLASGYFGRPDETREIFDARLADSGQGPFLRTGDLGFLHRGELFVTGRLKDLIVIQGRNYYPADLEASAASAYPGARLNSTAAVAIEGEEGEAIAIVQEVDFADRQELEKVAASIRRAIADDYDLAVGVVVFIRSGTLPKTTSGKVKRREAADALQAERLRVLFQARLVPAETRTNEPGVVESELKAIWEEVLGVRVAGDQFFAAGGDSLRAARVVTRVNQRYSLALPADTLFQAPTLPALARLVRETPREPEAEILAVPQSLDLPLLPAQKRIWFLEQVIAGNPFYHVAVRIDVRGALEPDRLKAALDGLVAGHDALRATFSAAAGTPRQSIVPEAKVALEVRDLSAGLVEGLIAEKVEAPFDLGRAPLLRAALFRTEDGNCTLVFVVHHIICDAWSLGILLEDLGDLYARSGGQRPAVEPRQPGGYAGYCLAQEESLRTSSRMEKQRRYWQNVFAIAPQPWRLPADVPAPRSLSNRGGRVVEELDLVTSRRLAELSAELGITPFMALACALAVLLHQRSGRTEIIIGAAAANRIRSDAERVVGCLINFLPLRIDLSRDPSVRAALLRVKEVCSGAYRNQEYPFEGVVQDIPLASGYASNPLYTVGLWLHNEDVRAPRFGVAAHARLVETDTSDLDLRVVALAPAHGPISLRFEYAADRFTRGSIERFHREYVRVLERMLERPDSRLSGIEGNLRAAPTLAVRIAANFTAEPIEEFLSFWLGELQLESEIRFAPYNQVMQQLLRGDSLLRANRDGINLIALDLNAGFAPGPPEEAQRSLGTRVSDFLAALRQAADSTAGGVVLVFPAAGERTGDARARLLDECSSIPGWTALDLFEAAELYDVRQIRDPFTDELGNIPFTEAMFAAAAAAAGREIRRRTARPRKVIVLDCDGTLWHGSCAEGTARITEPYRRLHEFMLRQRAAGVLLALASKNNHADVVAVLESEQSLLRPNHFSARRVNWLPKSENLASLAEELGLALESFLFVDDEPYECVEVRQRCPGVLALVLPPDAETIPLFLKRAWLFDRPSSTEEDRHRADLYRAERQRAEVKRAAPTLESFLAGLCIEVTIAEARDSDLARIAQLTQRTTQFNVTGTVHTEATLRQLLAGGRYAALIARVRDVFGDYGTAGAVLIQVEKPLLRVESFVLSCRALGRQVEDRMLDEIRRTAVEMGAERIAIVVRPTARNRPALEFMSRHCNIPEDLAEPCECVVSVQPGPSEWHPVLPAVAACCRQPEQPGEDGDALVGISHRFGTADAIVAAIRSRKTTRPAGAGAFIEPRGGLEQSLASIWSEVLGVEPIGAHDDFFAFGGHSLAATRVLARVREEYGVELQLSRLFQSPTVTGMAVMVANAVLDAADGENSTRVLNELEAGGLGL